SPASPSRQAGASRATGLSTIGRLIAADKRPSRIESHQTASEDPVRSNSTPPSHTPRKPPTRRLKKPRANSRARQSGPNVKPTRPDVGGTVDSQSKPITAPKMRVATVLGGSRM